MSSKLIITLCLALLAGCTAGPAVKFTPVPINNSVTFTREYQSLGSVDRVPLIESQERPVYPRAALGSNVVGEVELRFLVDEKGRTREIQVAMATDKVFADAAIRAIEQWTFTPAEKGGKKVAVAMNFPMIFRP